MSSRLLMTPLAILLLAGCNTAYRDIGPADPAFGEAVKWNNAVHIINPDPVYADAGAQPGDSGVKGAEAVERYRTDSVKEPESAVTTRRAGSGGSGGGSSSSQ